MNSGTKRLAITFAASAVLMMALLILGSQASRASMGGRVGYSGNPAASNGRDCTECHTTGAAKPTIRITGPTTVTAGASYSYWVTIKGGPSQTAGVNVSTQGFAGVLTPLNSELRVINQELTHKTPKPMVDGKAVFKFTWRAPAYPGVVTMYAAGNSSNGRLDMLGDGVRRSTLQITVLGSAPSPTPTPTPRPVDADIRLLSIVPQGTTHNFFQPLEIKQAGDDRLFVVQRKGVILIVKNGAKLSTSFLNLTTKVSTKGTNGLLGLAFHPQYATNRYFYVMYTYAMASGEIRSRVSRFRTSATDRNRAESAETVILDFGHEIDGHKAGAMHFGPDGYLYIAAGDSSTVAYPQPFSQDLTNLHGKILRIDVDGAGAQGCDESAQNPAHYAIPPGNPFADGPGGTCDEIWAYGLRNPWRFSIDRPNGDLWIADVGQSLYEEIDWMPAGGTAGLNFGWNVMEGQHCYNSPACDATGMTLPIYEYEHSGGRCSITGGLTYRGAALTNLAGHYVFADFCTGELWEMVGSPAAPVISPLRVWPAAPVEPVAFGEDCGGELYVVAYSEGEVYRVVAPNVSRLPAVRCSAGAASSADLPPELPEDGLRIFTPLWLQDSEDFRR